MRFKTAQKVITAHRSGTGQIVEGEIGLKIAVNEIDRSRDLGLSGRGVTSGDRATGVIAM